MTDKKKIDEIKRAKFRVIVVEPAAGKSLTRSYVSDLDIEGFSALVFISVMEHASMMHVEKRKVKKQWH